VSTQGRLDINRSETFEHLPKAPIAEAVIDIRALAQRKWEETAIRADVEPKLEGYSYQDSQREYRLELKGDAAKPPAQELRDLGWKGLRVRSSDKLHIAQFNRDGFVFSRLEPYADWEHMRDEALRLWVVYREIAKPIEVGRLGLRYINRIRMSPEERDFQRYIDPAPELPRGVGLNLQDFVHQDFLEVPGHHYTVRIVSTIQDLTAEGGVQSFVILDIDVGLQQKSSLEKANLAQHLEEMRWLKNKVFFGSITSEALNEFRGGAE
jgi:uncharacterized protein (TIGR04255 family)